jgi:DNA-binding transcriptional ArsR family regulator
MKQKPQPTLDRGWLEQLLAEELTISEIARRAGKAPSTVSHWMEVYGLAAVNRETHARPQNVDRDEMERLTAAGLTITEIAAELGVTTVTVRRRLARFGLKTAASRRVLLGRAGEGQGLQTITMSCPQHGDAEFVREGRRYYRCKLCRMECVARRRRKVKAILVADAGGSCCVCGYDRYAGALEFHHLHRANKRLEISQAGALSLERLRAEARKCVLVCSNCHAEVEAGVTQLPATVLAGSSVSIDQNPVDPG